jgi:hypothetical protein
MSTIQKVNFEPISDVLPIQRKDLSLADKSLAEPNNAQALIDGEWMTLDGSYKWARAAAIGTPGTAATVRSFPVFFERGRSDRLGMAERKTPCLFRGEYEFDTRVYDASATVGSGAPISSVMQPLKVATITIGSRNFVGLVGHGGSADTNPVVGYVTRLPSSNGGKLRFISGYRS